MRRTWPLLFALVLLPRGVGAQGNPLGPEFRVNTYTTGSQAGPSVAADSSGRFVVVWGSGSGEVFGQRFDASGIPIGPEFRVNTYTTGNQYLPEVGSDPSGSFAVVWTSAGQDGSDTGVYGQRYDSSGVPQGTEFRVNTYTTSTQRFPSVGFAGTGDFVVAWSSYLNGGGDGDVHGQRYSGSGIPLGPEFRANTVLSFTQSFVDVAADSAGNFVVVWSSEYQGSPSGPVIWGQRYASTGAPLGGEFLVGNVSPTLVEGGPSVQVNPVGDFVAVWHTCCVISEVFGHRFAASGAPLGGPFQVNTFTAGAQYGANIALDASGNFVVVWSSAAQDGSGYGAFGQRYDSSGQPLGPEFRVNTYTTGDQRRPSVAADPLGKFVVVWDSASQDGSGTGIFGQRYTPMFPVELIHLTVE
jgi:hypothetical protein